MLRAVVPQTPGMPTPRRAFALLPLALTPLVAAAAVSAAPAPESESQPDASVRVAISSKGSMLITGGDAADRITVSPSGDGLRVSVAGSRARVVNGAGCRAAGTARRSRCERSGVDLKKVVVAAGEGDDTVTVKSLLPANISLGAGNDRARVISVAAAKVKFPIVVRGGDGDDTMIGGDGNELFYGEDGDDLIDGRGGSDSAHGGAGDDLFIAGNRPFKSPGERYAGGDGRDTVNYRFISTGVNVSLDGVANDGDSKDATDNVKGDIERIIGGDGDDVLIGNDADNSIFGEAGNDRSYGMGGHDNIYETTGMDLLDGGPGDDRLRTREDPGKESPAMPDTLTCGQGADWVEMSTDDVADASCENVKKL